MVLEHSWQTPSVG